jgi:hypothetical protein
MKITGLLGIALLAMLIAIGASSCCSLNRYLDSHGIGPDASFSSTGAAVHVTLILRNIATGDFNQWTVASDQMCKQSSGKIRQDTEAFEQTWVVGGTDQHIRFWWDTLNGEADAEVLVNNVVVFEGHCAHFGHGRVQMIKTCSYPRVYKISGPGPYLREPLDRNETDIDFATSKLARTIHTP